MAERFENEQPIRSTQVVEERAAGDGNTSDVSLDGTDCHTGEMNSITSRGPDDHAAAAARDPLSARQHAALDLVLAGQSDGKVAKAVGVSRRTIIRWRMDDADFAAELQRRRQRLCDDAADRLRRLLAPSLDVLAECLKSDYDTHRLRAATNLLRIARVGTLLRADKEGE